jgi:hypothetical protein
MQQYRSDVPKQRSMERYKGDAHDVSTIVNSAKYDGSDCIRRVSDDDTRCAG